MLSAKKSPSIVICSASMPYYDGSYDRVLEYEAAIGSMQGLIDKWVGCKFVFGGDLNVTKYSSCTVPPITEYVCSANHLRWCDIDVNSIVNYTFHNDSVNNYSLIDHFICSEEIVTDSSSVTILNDGDNMPDHFAINNTFAVPHITTYDLAEQKCKANITYKKLWEKADITLYQSCLRSHLSNIVVPVHSLDCNSKNYCDHFDLEQYYRDIIHCLESSADSCIPSVKIGLQKHWWTPELDEMNMRCI